VGNDDRAGSARIIVAPDSFKGSLDADEVAAAIARGWRAVRPQDSVLEIPQADGGEGTLAAIERAVAGSRRRSAGWVTGPHGSPVAGSWLELPDGTAVVELALSSGIALMERLDPVGATTRGLGEVIAAALDGGCSRLVVALGGSASTDAGAPALEAIGARVPPPGGAVLLTDVTAPLLGPTGAAAVFGPQKGANPGQVVMLERRLATIADQLGGDPTEAGAGAAGGTAYGLATWGATIVPGAAEVAAQSGLTAAARDADLIITGEGRYDSQSLTGKVVGGVIDLDRPVALVAGAVQAPFPGWSADLVSLAGSVSAAMDEPQRWLELAGAAAARAFPERNRS
jgi:glycerate kinase